MPVDQLQPEQLLLACRLCLCPEQNVSLSSDSVANLHYAEIATHLLDFKIFRHASLPQQICMSCASNLILFYKFRTKCEEVNAALVQRCSNARSEPTTVGDNRVANADDGPCLSDGGNRLADQEVTAETESGNIVQLQYEDGTETTVILDPIVNNSCANTDAVDDDADERDSEFDDVIEEYLLEDVLDEDRTENDEIIEADLEINGDDAMMDYDDLESLHLSQVSAQSPPPDDPPSPSPSQTPPPPPRKSARPAIDAAGRRQFACAHCARQFTRKYTCEQHERTHRDLKEHECELCAARFTRSSHLDVHMRIHMNVRPYACDECGRRFTKSGDLQRHGWVHRAERDYRCTDCAKCFKRLSDLQSHQLTHTGRKPYVCGMVGCDKAYTSHSSLKKHRMRWH